MNRYKLRIVLSSIGIILVSFMMILSTYAYFTVKIEGSETDISIVTFNENTNIIFNDTSNVSMVNAYTGDKIVKNFTIENTSSLPIYYDIELINVVNNFSNKDDLVYTLISDNAAYRTESIIPSEDENIASNILIKSHEKHEYTMEITFLKTENDQNDNMGKTFSSKINIKPSKNINVGEYIYKNDTLLERIVTSSKGNNYEDEDGVYYTNSSNFGNTIYYYKGTDVNNNVVFDGNCYKIVRTDEDSNIRLLYNGEYTNFECVNPVIEESAFNEKSNYNAYVGYMYGDASSNNYKNEHNNIKSSTIKTALDSWFNSKLSNEDKYISNTAVYCNNRKTTSFVLNNVLYGILGYANNNTGYYGMKKDYESYECDNLNDRFSVASTYGNNVLNYSVGLISSSEVEYSLNKDNKSFLLDQNYWTLSAAYFNGNNAYNFVVTINGLETKKVSEKYGVRPVISVVKTIKIIKGEGTIENPFILGSEL